MAWNGSDQNASSPGGATSTKSPRPAQGTRHKARGTKHGLLALLLIAALGGVAVWYFTRPAPPPPPAQGTKHKVQSTIASVTPAPARTNAVDAAKAARRARFLKKYEGRLGPDGRVVRPPWPPCPYGEVTNGVGRAKSAVEVAFTCHTDQQIASILMMEPGDELVCDEEEDRHIFKHFNRDFEKSLETPILSDPNDSDFVRDLKDAVRQLRGELKQRMDAGEDLSQVMIDSRKEMRELSLYREELNKMVREAIADKKFDGNDLRDYVGAANSMLRDRGVREIKIPEIHYRRAELRAQKVLRENNGQTGKDKVK